MNRPPASAEQAAADLENTRLVLAAQVAAAYFNLGATDVELAVLARAEALQQRAKRQLTTVFLLKALGGDGG